MSGLRHAALPALGAAVLFGASTPFAKQLIGDDFATSSPFLLAGLLYLGSGVGLTLIRLIRDRGWKTVDLPQHEWPWLLGAIAFGGVLGPLLLMVGLSHTTAATASLLLNLESVLTAVLAWLVFRENTDRRILLGMVLIVAGGAVLTWPTGETSASASGMGPLALAGAGAYFSTAPFVGAALSIAVFGEPTGAVFWMAAFLMAAGVWLHLTEHHIHDHEHAELSHGHRHRHDEPISTPMILTGTE